MKGIFLPQITEETDLNTMELIKKYQDLENIDSMLKDDLVTGVKQCIGIAVS